MTKFKAALLAAVSFAAVSASGAPPQAMEPAPIEHAVAASHDEAETRTADIAVKHWMAGGAVAAALAGLIRLFGWTRIAGALRKTGEALVAAPAAAARYAGEAIRSPVRSVLIIGGLSLFALAGVGFYDVEWLAGLATGLALTLAGVVGISRIRRFFVRR